MYKIREFIRLQKLDHVVAADYFGQHCFYSNSHVIGKNRFLMLSTTPLPFPAFLSVLFASAS
jgi:hypothetical protein